MRMAVSSLAAALKSGLAPVYLISGDEALLSEEAFDQIRDAARGQGFLSRETAHVDKQFSVDGLLADAGTLSLFSEKRLLELRCASAPNKEFQDAIVTLLEQDDADRLLLISMPALKRKTDFDARWIKAIEQRGVHAQASAPEPAQWPGWLAQRAKSQKLNLQADALEWLVQCCEGNLLAAQQMLSQLRLLHGEAPITLEQVQAITADDARFEVWSVLDVALRGDLARTLRILQSLQGEDADGHLRALVPAVQRDVRQLAQIVFAQQRGASAEQKARELGIWSSRLGLFTAAAKRFSLPRVHALLALADQIERQMKGVERGLPWPGLERALAELAGRGFATAGRPA